MRVILAALVALLCCPAAAPAAPFAEPPFLPLGRDRTATCLQALGGDRVALVGTAGGRQEAVELFRVGADGALAPDGTVPIGVSHRVPDAAAPCPGVAASASGAAVVASARFTSRGGRLAVAVREPGGRFGASQRLPVPRRAFVGDVRAAVASSGAAVVVWLESLGTSLRVRAVSRTAAGAFGPPATLTDGAYPFAAPVVGIDDAGTATVAWVREDRGGNRAPELATVAPGAAFGAPQRLEVADVVEQLSLAVAADGGVLLAFRDDPGIRVFERFPDAASMTPAAAFPRSRSHAWPAVALAPGGGAVLAWLAGRRSIEVALRAPGGGFQPPQALSAMAPGAAGWSAFGPLPTFRPLLRDGALQVAVGADGAVVVGWAESPDPVRIGLAAGTLTGGWEGTTLLGGPGRAADGLAVLAAPAAALWTDNLLGTVFGHQQPVGGGRLHRALPGVVTGPEPAPPELRLRARSQRIRAGQPVVVTARCSAACDLRAVSGRADGAGAAELRRRGTARIALHPEAGKSLLARSGRPLRVVVHATAPGGRRETVARIAVRVTRGTRD